MSKQRVLIGVALVVLLAPFFVFGSGAIQSAYNLIQNSGTPLTRRQTLNFTGSGVSCADAAPVTTCTIPGSATPPASATVIGTNASSVFIAASLTSGDLWVGNGSNLPAAAAPSGDVNMTNAGVFTVVQIEGGAIPASALFLGTNGSKQLSALTAAQATAALNVFTSTLQGVVAASAGGTTNFLRADGNWEPPPATSPCTTQSASLQYDNGGLFGCVSQVTYSSPVLTYLITGLGTTEQDAIFFQNTTAAASGAQQLSPSIHFEGQGWKTTATAGSEAVDIYMNAQPVQDTTNPDVMLPIYPGINGSVRGNPIAYFCANGTGTSSQVGLFGLDGQGGGTGCSIGSPTYTGIGNVGSISGTIGIWLGGSVRFNFNQTGNLELLGSATGLAWESGSSANSTTGDTSLCRAAAGEVLVYDGAACGTTAANMRDIELRSIVAGGSTPSISGCSAGTQTGGATAGTYASGTNGTCTVTITFATTAPTGWAVTATDITTAADATQVQTASSQTTATISGTTVSGDTIIWQARAY